nr:hypothetical protein [Tanacetum cinerariifolium]
MINLPSLAYTTVQRLARGHGGDGAGDPPRPPWGLGSNFQREDVHKGIEDYFAKLYSNNKQNYKAEMWTTNGEIATAKQIRRECLNNVEMLALKELGTMTKEQIPAQVLEGFMNEPDSTSGTAFLSGDPFASENPDDRDEGMEAMGMVGSSRHGRGGRHAVGKDLCMSSLKAIKVLPNWGKIYCGCSNLDERNSLHRRVKISY